MSRRKVILLAVAFVAILTGIVLVLVFGDSGQSSAGESHHNSTMFAILPIYTSLIAVFVATRTRRRRGCGRGAEECDR